MAFTHHTAECFVLSMIIDAMSKWKTDLPHFAREPKMLDGKGQPVSFPLTASKIHNLGIFADWQMDGTLEGPGSGTNAMCCIILANLHAVYKAKKEIPMHLRLQMDNCAKDNKNHTILGLIALLVQAGVVLTTEVTYLLQLSYHTRMAQLLEQLLCPICITVAASA